MNNINHIRTKYPHLLPKDALLWTRFLALYGAQFIRFDYDVRVGHGRPFPFNANIQMPKMALDLSMRRIDAVGFTADEIFIIEITKLAGLKSVGQLISYPYLYSLTFNPTNAVIPLLVTEEIRTDLRPVFESKNIPVIIIPKEVEQ